MKVRTYLGALVAITTGLFITGMYAATPSSIDTANESGDLEHSVESHAGEANIATQHDSDDNWQTVLMRDGTECEGLVFESAEDAEEAALKMGCSGYHEHHQEDGTVLYMPCESKLTDALLDVEGIKAEILSALASGEITQEQFDEKLDWLQAKNL